MPSFPLASHAYNNHHRQIRYIIITHCTSGTNVLLFNGERKIRGSESSLSFSLRVPGSESLRERKFSVFSLPAANIPYWELSLTGAKVPKREKAHFRQDA